MATPGRNDLCPCRSGRKYKRCCLVLHQRARSAEVAPTDFEAHINSVEAMSNDIPDLYFKGRFDEAEKLAQRLIDEAPDQPDGLDRIAEVYAEKGDHPKAAHAFRRAALFHRVLMPENEPTAAWLEEQAERMDQGLKMVWPDYDLV